MIGENIKKYREKAGLTQEDLGEKSSLGQSFISKVERGIREPSINGLKAIAEALNVDCAELLK